jgi:hypothetical protein
MHHWTVYPGTLTGYGTLPTIELVRLMSTAVVEGDTGLTYSSCARLFEHAGHERFNAYE